MQNKTLNEIQPLDKPVQRDQRSSICFTLNERRGFLKCCIGNKEHAQVTALASLTGADILRGASAPLWGEGWLHGLCEGRGTLSQAEMDACQSTGLQNS